MGKLRLFLLVTALTVLALPAFFYLRSAERDITSATLSQAPSPAPTSLPISVPIPATAAPPARCRKPFPDKFLRLGGTLVLTDPKQSVSLIHVRGGAGVAVHVGEPIGNRRYEVLAIGRNKVCVRPAGKEKEEAYLLTVESVPASAIHSLGEAVGIKQVTEFGYRVPRTLIRAELNNLMSILSSASAVPDMQNGKFVGFLLQSVDSSSIFRTLGLEAGDHLKGANKITFTNPADGLRAYQELLNAQTVEIHLVRNGRPITLRYDVQ